MLDHFPGISCDYRNDHKEVAGQIPKLSELLKIDFIRLYFGTFYDKQLVNIHAANTAKHIRQDIHNVRMPVRHKILVKFVAHSVQG